MQCNRLHIVTTFIVAVFALMITHCGKDTAPTEPDVDVSENIMKGWEFFEQIPPDYPAALEQFSGAILLNPNSAEAYIGRGWTYSRLAFGSDDINYSRAVDDFDRAINRGGTVLDAWAGLALVQLVLNDYEGAISSADSVVLAEPNYVFAHDTEVTARDLQLVKAQAYFFLGKYDEVVSLLNILQPGEPHPVDKPEVLLIQLQNLWTNSFG